MHNETWAITSYFNPMRYRTRLENYRVFRRHMPLPLATVELSFDNRFDLTTDDADLLVARQGSDVMWHKERLLNIAVAALPDTCRNVLWVDCDVVFVRDDWPSELTELLERFDLVQAFSRLVHYPRGTDPARINGAQPFCVETSVAAIIDQGRPVGSSIQSTNKRGHGYNRGIAWAARKNLLIEHGLYEACIVGGGDSALVAAAWGHFDTIFQRHRMNKLQRDFYMAWAEPFFAGVGGNVASLRGDLIHLWHGEFEDRRMLQRHKDMHEYRFDPRNDIAYDSSGCLCWNSHKPSMHTFVKNHLASRKEDG